MSDPACSHANVQRNGRCADCGERIESPSQALLEYASEYGMTIVRNEAIVRIRTPPPRNLLNGESFVDWARRIYLGRDPR